MSISTTWEKLLNNSLSAAIAGIEIYNKPQFSYRNEVFCMLMVNAWELLLKAKILHDNGDKIESIYALDNKGNTKVNRNGSVLTVEVYRAMNIVEPHSIVKDNISAIVDLRDTCTHYISSKPMDYLVFTLGTACLRNFQHCIKEWFGRDLLEYNFYILPLGFSHNFKSFRMLELEKEPEEVKRLIKNVADCQNATEKNDNFHFNCEINITLVSAKKVTSDTDLEVSVSAGAKEAIFIEKAQKVIDRYQYSSDEIWNMVHMAIPELKQNQYYQFLKEKEIKNNEKYSAYNFRYKRQEDDYRKTGKVANGTASLYNEECVKFMMVEIPKFLKRNKKQIA